MATKLSEIVPKEFLERIERGVELVRSAERGRIVSDHDGDGIAAAGILATALMREGKGFHATLSRKLWDDEPESICVEPFQLLLVSDSGSGRLKLLEKLECDTIVLDHHSLEGDSEKVVHINPRLFGMDGTTEASASTLAFTFALALNDENWDLFPLALAGAIADMQHIGGLKGLNKKLLEVALERGEIETRRSLALRGRTIKQSLLTNHFPYFDGLTGNEKGIEEELGKLGIDPDTPFEDLDESSMTRLTSYLALKLLKQSVRPETVEDLVQDGYWLPSWEMYADELSDLINSCGRMHEEGTGLSVCFRDDEAIDRARKVLDAYRRRMVTGFLKVVEEGAYEKDNIQFFYTDNSAFAGSWAGVAMRYVFDQEKPTLALSVRDGVTKISGRGTSYLVKKGVDLAAALKEASEMLGGTGGGHDVAAGAQIPKGKEEKFLEMVDQLVGAQLTVAEE